MIKVLLTGSNGQLGNSLIESKPKNITLIKTYREDLNLLDKFECAKFIENIKPDWIINAAAYTSVEKAETNIHDTFKINFDAVKSFSEALKIYGGKLLQISTDYVFDGKQNSPYFPYSKRNPLNVYGDSKFQAEKEIEKIFKNTNQAIILRTSWLMSCRGNNFALKILELLKNKKDLNIVSDQIGSPTTTSTLALTCWKLIQQFDSNSTKNTNGAEIFHFTNAGIASWHDIAQSIYEFSIEKKLINHKIAINPISHKTFKSKVKRPNYSVLDSSSTYDLLKIKPIHWKSALFEELSKLSQKKSI